MSSMKNKFPFLIVIPGGGYGIPFEFQQLINLNKFDLFIDGDTCANEIFNLKDTVLANLETDISKNFINLDKPLNRISKDASNGVINKLTDSQKTIFKNNYFPDDIAISNILKRYHIPFYKTIDKIINTGEIKFLFICETHFPISPILSKIPGKPEPLAKIDSTIFTKTNEIPTCKKVIIDKISKSLEKQLSTEKNTVEKKILINSRNDNSYIASSFYKKIPIIRFSFSKSLFINEKYFNYDYLSVDNLRLNQIQKIFLNSITSIFE